MGSRAKWASRAQREDGEKSTQRVDVFPRALPEIHGMGLCKGVRERAAQPRDSSVARAPLQDSLHGLGVASPEPVEAPGEPMKHLSRVSHVIAREVVARLFADAVIQRHPLWACALELELAAVMREYVAEDNRLDTEVRETLERQGGQSRERFARLKQELARERGFPLGDAGVAHMVKTMAEHVEDSPLASSAGMPAHVLRTRSTR